MCECICFVSWHKSYPEWSSTGLEMFSLGVFYWEFLHSECQGCTRRNGISPMLERPVRACGIPPFSLKHMDDVINKSLVSIQPIMLGG